VSWAQGPTPTCLLKALNTSSFNISSVGNLFIRGRPAVDFVQNTAQVLVLPTDSVAGLAQLMPGQSIVLGFQGTVADTPGSVEITILENTMVSQTGPLVPPSTAPVVTSITWDAKPTVGLVKV
jgi:hypothetical protein